MRATHERVNKNIGALACLLAIACQLVFPLAASAAERKPAPRAIAPAPAPAPHAHAPRREHAPAAAPVKPRWNLLSEARAWEGWGENSRQGLDEKSGLIPSGRFLLKPEPRPASSDSAGKLASGSFEYGFQGRERDNESGLQHFRARSYDPMTGRFTSRDPVPYSNLYYFVANDPVNRTDPSGRDVWDSDYTWLNMFTERLNRYKREGNAEAYRQTYVEFSQWADNLRARQSGKDWVDGDAKEAARIAGLVSSWPAFIHGNQGVGEKDLRKESSATANSIDLGADLDRKAEHYETVLRRTKYVGQAAGLALGIYGLGQVAIVDGLAVAGQTAVAGLAIYGLAQAELELIALDLEVAGASAEDIAAWKQRAGAVVDMAFLLSLYKGIKDLPNPLARQISRGHSYDKHVVVRKEYPAITSRGAFARLIDRAMRNPAKDLQNGRKAYWDEETGTVVITNPKDPDGGTAFRPTDGKAYYDNLK